MGFAALNPSYGLTHPDLRNTARVRAFLDFAAAEIGRRKKTIEGMEWGGVGAERAEPQ